MKFAVSRLLLKMYFHQTEMDTSNDHGSNVQAATLKLSDSICFFFFNFFLHF